MYELFDSLNDNVKIKHYYNSLDNYKVENLGGGVLLDLLYISWTLFSDRNTRI